VTSQSRFIRIQINAARCRGAKPFARISAHYRYNRAKYKDPPASAAANRALNVMCGCALFLFRPQTKLKFSRSSSVIEIPQRRLLKGPRATRNPHHRKSLATNTASRSL
jgi:hypothetical protein